MKIKILFDGVFEIDNRPRACVAGEVLDVLQENALLLIDGLCAELYMDGGTADAITVSDSPESTPKRRKKAVAE